MKQFIYFLLIGVFLFNPTFGQKGQVWSTVQKFEFETDAEGNVFNETKPFAYHSYYQFITDEAFIHCTKDATRLYTIESKMMFDDYADYKVISPAGNAYFMRFSLKDKKIVIFSIDKKYGSTIQCSNIHETAAFDALTIQ